jgi:hypothetical protein
MFFLLPKVTLILLLIFGIVLGMRMLRQRNGAGRPRRRKRRTRYRRKPM